jgi:hypothetical protein
MIGVIAILIACCNLIDSLSQQLKQCMIRMSCGPRVIDLGRRSMKDIEPLIDLPEEKEAGVGSDLCAQEINADGAVKFRPYRPCLFVTNCAHADFPPSDEFAT